MPAYNPPKTYAVVLFIEEGSIEVIPTNWMVSEDETRWPNISSSSVVTKYIQQRCLPTNAWTTLKIKIYGFSNSFKSAKEKANHAEETSNIGSDSSEEIESSKRKRKRPIRYESDDSFSESESILKPVKKHPIPKLPKEVAEKNISTECEIMNVDTVTKKQLVDSSASSHSEVTDSTHYNYLQVMSKRIFEHLELLHSEMKELINAKYNKILHYMEKCGTSNQLLSFDNELPPGIVLPINNDVMLSNLNEKIKNESQFSSNLIRYLHGLGYGKTPRAFILSMTKKLLSADLAVTYSRIGRKGKKSFSDYSETLNVILAAAAIRFKDTNREDLAEMFGKCLAGAAEWNGRKIRPFENSSLSFSEE